MATVLITGGTGMIGTALTNELVQRGDHVILLSRDANKNPAHTRISYAEWNLAKQTIDTRSIQNTDYIIHLAGANVAGGRWTQKRKKEIVDSRVQSGRLLVKALNEIPNKVQALFSSSAVGWYGPDPQIPNARPFVETDPADSSFLGTTCRQWEAAIGPVVETGMRLVIFRTGIVFSNEGGAYTEFKKPMKFGVASVLGSGKQIISWIHITDLVRLFIYAIENQQMQGIYNAVTPNPVSNKELITEMAKHNGFHITAHVPAFALKAALGEMSVEILKSATVSSKKLEATGFKYFFADIRTAVHNLTKKAS